MEQGTLILVKTRHLAHYKRKREREREREREKERERDTERKRDYKITTEVFRFPRSKDNNITVINAVIFLFQTIRAS